MNLSQDKKGISLDRIIDLVESSIDKKLHKIDIVADKVEEMQEILINVSQLQNEISRLQTMVVAKDMVIETLEKNNERFINENFDYKMKQKELEAKLEETNITDIEQLKFFYKELLEFAFKNLGPTTFDPQEARFHWENLVK